VIRGDQKAAGVTAAALIPVRHKFVIEAVK
jgi:hypothetical protein